MNVLELHARLTTLIGEGHGNLPVRIITENDTIPTNPGDFVQIEDTAVEAIHVRRPDSCLMIIGSWFDQANCRVKRFNEGVQGVYS